MRPDPLPDAPAANLTQTTSRYPAHTIRSLRHSEENEIRRIFRATLLLGRPLPVLSEDLATYERLCLDWYLQHGHIRVVDVDGRISGYLLACLDQPGFDRWVRARAVRWAGRSFVRIGAGRCRGDARRFVWLRMIDALRAWRHAPRPVHRAHAHINLDAGLRGARIGHHLVAAMDDLVLDAGLDGWFGEMNLPVGRRVGAIERAGATIVYRQPSRTFTWLLGSPVERATVQRPLAVIPLRSGR